MIINSDALTALKTLPDKSAQMCVTSPPYFGLRDYGVEGQLGLEDTPEEYITRLVAIFREVKRVLKDDGTLWVNIGDSYNGSGKNSGIPDAKRKYMMGKACSSVPTRIDGIKDKDLIGVPWLLAFAPPQ